MRSIQFENQSITPGKIVCIGKNYAAHIEEMNSAVPEQMVVFMKPNSAIGTTLRAVADEPLHYECEICLLVKNGDILGIGVGLDLTKRDLQGKLKQAGLPWERAKAFDGAALFSEFIAAPVDPLELRLELWVDRALRQSGEATAMLYQPSVIVGELNTFLTLDDFDVIMTGTPAGVGPIAVGEHFEARLLQRDSTLISASWTAL
ncbi:fumarylacetoacetate hydrolase family protein [Luminiphilus sp. nBUS_07]|uniref:fumarylacetoacetate hydrolase family protein n=1 Tax=Luminiphilus sp. nBUS_07 TaxID=3395314 RepID=UPI003EBA9E11